MFLTGAPQEINLFQQSALRLAFSPSGKSDANDSAAFFMQYSLSALSPEDLIERWRSRGLSIPNEPLVLRQVKTVGYHRLNRYARFLRDQQGNFRSGLTYNGLWTIYTFDRRLRLLSLDAIEHIEVAVKAIMSDFLSQRHSPHWFMNSQLFNNISYAIAFQNIIENEIHKTIQNINFTKWHGITKLHIIIL